MLCRKQLAKRGKPHGTYRRGGGVGASVRGVKVTGTDGALQPIACKVVLLWGGGVGGDAFLLAAKHVGKSFQQTQGC